MNEVLKALLLRKLAGRGGGGGYPEPTGTKQITANGTGIDIKDFATADVNVPNTYAAGDEGKVVDNGTLVSQTAKSVTENGTHNTTKNNSVVVNVPNSYSASDEGKVVQSGALVAQTQKSVNANGTYDTTANNSVVVDVPSSAGLKEYTSSALPKSTFKGWTTTFNAGNTLTVALAPTDGTIVEVGDEVLVHGEITSSAGGFAYYVTGVVTSIDSLSKPVITVKGLGQPSPIADGTYPITSNGDYNVKEYSKVSVNVEGTETTYITENGTFDVGSYKWANVNVEGGSPGKILFATNATYSSEPIQGNNCSAEVLNVDLSLYTPSDKVVLYGEEPNYTMKNYLVVGTITSFSLPSVVYFDVNEVREISGGGGDKGGFVVLNKAGGDDNPAEGMTMDVYPNSPEDLDGVNVGDSLLAQGSFPGGYYVLFGKVTKKGFEYVAVSVIKALSSDNDGSTWVLDCSADYEPTDGDNIFVILADSSSAANLNQNEGLIGRLTAGGVDYAFYGQVDRVVDQGKGKVLVVSRAHIAIPFS